MKRKMRFAKRPVSVVVIFCVLFCTVIGRLAFLCGKSSYPAAASKQCERKYVLGETRGKIYDINMIPFYPYSEKNVRVELKSAENGSSGFAVVNASDSVKGRVATDSVTVVEQKSENTLCRHMIGYVNGEGSGVCGIQRAFDRILDEGSGSLWAQYTVNALGQAIPGAGVTIKNDNYNSPAGVVLTVDMRVQQIIENALANSDISCGACVVLRPESGEIAAIASVPAYDVDDLAAALNDENKPFLNRALCAYPVGSVFKPFVAAAAAEDGADLNAEFECTGSVKVGDVTFGCFDRRVHGKIDLTGAVENSCNCYFIEKGLATSPETLYKVCSDFGFGKSVRLFSGTESAAGNMPHYDSETKKGMIANLCFGQGELLASPLQVAAAYGALANGGEYREPYILKYLVNDEGENYAEYRSENFSTVISGGLCSRINEALYMNMLDGTGKNGSPASCSSAGKTATAQTGEYNDRGVERLCTWFAGFFPFEAPEYAVVVFNENGSAAAVDCAPVFKEISEEIMKLS